MVRLPCGSRSMTRTRFPVSASATPRLSVVVVFATPPFWFANTMTFAITAPSSRGTGAVPGAGTTWRRGVDSSTAASTAAGSSAGSARDGGRERIRDSAMTASPSLLRAKLLPPAMLDGNTGVAAAKLTPLGLPRATGIRASGFRSCAMISLVLAVPVVDSLADSRDQAQAGEEHLAGSRVEADVVRITRAVHEKSQPTLATSECMRDTRARKHRDDGAPDHTVFDDAFGLPEKQLAVAVEHDEDLF